LFKGVWLKKAIEDPFSFLYDFAHSLFSISEVKFLITSNASLMALCVARIKFPCDLETTGKLSLKDYVFRDGPHFMNITPKISHNPSLCQRNLKH
jgi:hypothetical protein